MTYLVFKEVADTGKTKVWRVGNSNDGSYLGTVKWYGAWRKYVFYSERQTIWSQDCLQDLANFIGTQMSIREVQRAKKELEKSVAELE